MTDDERNALIHEYSRLCAQLGIYKCLHCGHEEKVSGSLSSGPVVAISKVLDIKAVFANTRIKAIAEAEIRHVRRDCRVFKEGTNAHRT